MHLLLFFFFFFFLPEHDYDLFPGNFDAEKKLLQVIPFPHPRVFQTLPKNQKLFQVTHTCVVDTKEKHPIWNIMGHLLGLHSKVVNPLFMVEVHLAIKLDHRYVTFNNIKET